MDANLIFAMVCGVVALFVIFKAVSKIGKEGFAAAIAIGLVLVVILAIAAQQ